MPRRPAPGFIGKNENRRATERAETITRDAAIWERRRSGMSTTKIAAELSLSTKMVEQAISRIFQEYRVAITGEVEAKAGELISQYEYVRDEALDAWRSSKQPRRRLSQTTTKRADEQDVADAGVVSTTVGQDDSHGDAKYLETALKAMGELKQLLRVQEAVQVTVTHQGPDGGPVRLMSDINYDELEGPKLAQYLAALGQAALTVSQPLIDVTPTRAESLPEPAPPEVLPAPPDEPDLPF